MTDVRTAMTEAKQATGDKNVLVHGAGTAQLALAADVSFFRDSFADSLQPVEEQENRYEPWRNACCGLSADKAGAGTHLQLYLTACLIGATVPITQLHDLYGEKVRVTVTGSLTRNRQWIYFL